jgi:DNA polymerase-3 subunit beta
MAITGLLLDFNAIGLVLVGTDGHKLVKRILKEYKTEAPEQIVVPEKTVAILSKILDDQEVTLFHNSTFVHFQMPEVYLISKLITQKYPAYNNVIPLENENLLIVERAPFVEAVRRMLLFSNPRFQQIRLSIKEDMVELFSEDANSQSSGLDTLSCEYKGTPMDISFNPSFLQEILLHLESPKVVFQLDTPTRASVILPTENKNENEEVVSLLMPVRLTSYS